MTYCKHCGMESKDPKRCEWCGKDLTVTPTAQIPEVKTTEVIIEEEEERGREARTAFFIVVGCMVAVAAGLIIWRLALYPSVTLATLFVAGILVAAMGILPTFEDEWLEVAGAIVLRVALPGPLGILAYIGYVIWARIRQTVDDRVVWLLGVYLGILTILQVLTIIVVAAASAHGGVATVPISVGVQFYFIEVLGLAAFLIGWIVSSSFSPMNR